MKIIAEANVAGFKNFIGTPQVVSWTNTYTVGVSTTNGTGHQVILDYSNPLFSVGLQFKFVVKVTDNYSASGTAKSDEYFFNETGQQIQYNKDLTNSTDIYINPRLICKGEQATIIAEGNGWRWGTEKISGNGINGKKTAQSVTVTSTSNGNFEYTVEGFTNAGTIGCFVKHTDNLTVYQPNINVTAAKTALCLGEMLTLNASGGSTYTWSSTSPGNGLSISSGATLNITPTTPGQKMYNLLGTDAAGCSNTASIAITVNDAPTALWDAPHFITYADQQSLNYINNLSTPPTTPPGITNYLWDFNYTPSNPLPSSLPPIQMAATINNNNPLKHTYATCGQKTILLEAIGPGSTYCKDYYEDHIYITEEVSPDFTFASTAKCQGSAVNFQNTSTLDYGGNMSLVVFEWDFGDGSSTVSQNGLVTNTSHTYTNAGIYTITLTAYNPNMASNVFTKTKQVIISPNPYISAFTTSGHCQGQDITFNDVTTLLHPSSSTVLHQWDWNNDGNFDESNWTISSLDSRNHSFASAGTKSVTMRRTYSTGCFSELTQNITVDPTPVAAATKTPSDICESGSIVISAANSTLSAGTIGNYVWHLQRDNSTDEWFRYGNTSTAHTQTFSNTQAIMQPPYQMIPGAYTVDVSVTSVLGCTDEASATFNVWENPATNFTNTTVCNLNDVATQFTNTTLNQAGATHSFNWNFGGQGNSSSASPSFDFSTDGSYSVTLTVTESAHNCSQALTKTVVVKPNPIADFTTSINLCDNQDIDFTDNSTIATGTLTNWEWNWGYSTSNTNTTNNIASHNFANAGTYNVNMNVTGSNGCTQNITKAITLGTKPNKPSATILANAAGNTSPICFGESFEIEASTIAAGNTYSWYLNGIVMGGATANTISEAITSWSPYTLATRDYVVRVTDQSGCYNSSDPATINIIKLNTGFGFQGGQQNILCNGQSTVLTGVVPTNVQSYQWQRAAYDDVSQTFSTSYATVGTNAKTHTVTNLAPGRYRYLTSNATGSITCTEMSDGTEDIINALPLTLNTTGTVSIDPNNPLILNHLAQTYPTYTNFAWYLNDKQISTTSSIEATMPGAYYLIADGDCGREKSNTVNVVLDCNSAGYNQSLLGTQTFTTSPTFSPATLGGNKYVKVDGNWNISAGTLTLQDIVLVMDNCAAITIAPNAGLDASNTSIVGCADWEGIVANGGDITLDNVKIAGAQVGVLVTNNGDFDITDCLFDNNYVHIGIDGVTNVANLNTVTTTQFGNVAENASSCNNANLANWNLAKRPYVYATSSNAIRFINNDFSSSINNPQVEPIAIQLNGVNNAILSGNDIYGWYETGIKIENGDDHTIAQNNLEFGFVLNGITQAQYMGAPPTFPANTGLYMYNADGNSIAQNEFYGLNKGMEFYQVKSNPTATAIEKNKFASNMVGILSSTNANPMVSPAGVNTNNAVEIQVSCNNFTSNTYGWVGTGTYPNQGTLNVHTGNVFSSSGQWDILVERNGRDYYYPLGGVQPSLGSGILLDGSTATQSLFPNTAPNSPNCSGMRLKADPRTINGMEDELTIDFTKPVIYPNPFEDKFSIVVENSDSYSISVLDLNGKIIYTKLDATGDEHIMLDGLRKGVYIATITSGEQIYHYRLIKAQ